MRSLTVAGSRRSWSKGTSEPWTRAQAGAQALRWKSEPPRAMVWRRRSVMSLAMIFLGEDKLVGNAAHHAVEILGARAGSTGDFGVEVALLDGGDEVFEE